VLGEAAVAAGKTDTFLGERYRRIARRRGAKKAIVAVGRSILVIVWHLLSDPNARFHDLGPGLLRHPQQRRSGQAQPRPPAPSTRRQSHPRTRRLTSTRRQPDLTDTTRLRSAPPGAAACPLTVDFRISRGSPCGDAVRA
jgi:hypothetical protein